MAPKETNLQGEDCSTFITLDSIIQEMRPFYQKVLRHLISDDEESRFSQKFKSKNKEVIETMAEKDKEAEKEKSEEVIADTDKSMSCTGKHCAIKPIDKT